MFNPTRFACVRKRLGLSKSRMAWLIGVDLRTVSAYEAGTSTPRNEVLERIKTKTGFPVAFFSGDDLEEPGSDSASFRAMSKMSAGQRDMALSQGAIANHLAAFIEERFDLPKVDIPDLSHEPTPEAASERLREYWGIGVLPINHMIHLLESKGVRVFSLAINAREVDAFSVWRGGETPMAFLNMNKTAEHSRYDAAHELGHLILHRHAAPQGRDAEHQADRFASAFLMPRGSVLAHGRRNPTFAGLVELKKIWKVSVAALNYRLHAVGLTSDWLYRKLCIEIAKYGRGKEPNEIQRETSQILPKIFAALHEENVSRSDVADLLTIPRAELEQLMFGLTLAALEGGRKSTAASGPQQTNLRLVSGS
jgi:Zn-dependent peptidase ImmA (M78 family)/DNA-binding XRE family transcriptional regulator